MKKIFGELTGRRLLVVAVGATTDSETKGLIATYGKTVDFTNRKTIAPVLAYIAGES